MKRALDRELAGGLRTWEAVFHETGFIPTGIGAHGLWDAWHIGHSAFLGPRYITRWYAVFCLVVDVGFAAYAASVLRNLAAGSQRPRGLP